MKAAEMQAIRERVAHGAQLLDEVLPRWKDRIDLDSLCMSTCSRCVLGQLFTHFPTGVEKLWGLPEGIPNWKEAANHGFDAYDGNDDAEWIELQQEWSRQIAKGR